MYNIYVERKVKIMSIENSKKYEEIIKNKTLKANEEFHNLSEEKKNDFTIRQKQFETETQEYSKSLDNIIALNDEDYQNKSRALDNDLVIMKKDMNNIQMTLSKVTIIKIKNIVIKSKK